MKTQILEIINQYDNVSFAELSKKIDGFRGDLMFGYDFESFSNIILWANISQQAIDAIDTIITEKQAVLKPCSLFVYVADGLALNMPIAKSKRHYKKPRWLPVVFKKKSK